MHKYLTMRGCPQLIRRLIEDLQKVYLKYNNKKTGKFIGAVQLMPREIVTYELIFPEQSKKDIKKIVKRVMEEVCPPGGGIALHWGPTKKDKYNKKGEELL